MNLYYDDDSQPVSTTGFEYPEEETTNSELEQWEDCLSHVLTLLRGDGTKDMILERCLGFILCIVPETLERRHLLRGLCRSVPPLKQSLQSLPDTFLTRLRLIGTYLSDVRYVSHLPIKATVFLYVFRQLPEIDNQSELATRLGVSKQAVSVEIDKCKQHFGI